jgi:methionyl-tRNA formyltransferase
MAGRIVIGIIGLKGLTFIETLLRNAISIDEIVTYQQADDRADSFNRLREIANTFSICFTETRYPHFQLNDLALLVGWQFLLPHADADIIVFHDSLLPRYRGFAPTATALIKGDTEIGVTAISPSEAVDEGPIFGQKRATISYPIKIKDALCLQAKLMAELAIELIGQWRKRTLTHTPQHPDRATFSIWRDEHDYEIDWSMSAIEIQRFVDAVGYPYLGARTTVGGMTAIRVHDVSVSGDLAFEIRNVGKVLRLDEGRPIVICGSGLLRIDHCTTENGSTYRFERLRVRLGEKSF